MKKPKQKVVKIIKPSCGGCGKEVTQPTKKAGWCDNCWRIPVEESKA